MEVITIRGKVKKGQGRGKALEFPTANMRVKKTVPEGIYISYTLIDERELPSLTFIGIAETFGEKKYQAETYILDFSDSLYGVWITVRLLKKIRGGKIH